MKFTADPITMPVIPYSLDPVKEANPASGKVMA
jgi:hypothetical protein